MHLAERAGHRDEVEPLLRRLGAAGMAKLFSPNVEWTVLPVDAALRAGVAPAVVRDVLGPMQELAREAPWCPLGEAMLVAAEGDHLKALEQLDLVLTHPEPEVPAYVLAAAWFTAARSHLALGARTDASDAASALARSSRGGRATDETRSMPSSAEPVGPHRRRTETSRAREREVAAPGRAGSHQRRDREAALHLAADRSGPRVEHPGQAGSREPLRAHCLGHPVGPGRPRRIARARAAGCGLLVLPRKGGGPAE